MNQTRVSDQWDPLLVSIMDIYADAVLDSADDMPPVRESHRRAAPLAHGWYVRCHRTAQALRLLHLEGFDGEASPLCRTLVEHTVALRWLAAEGDKILPTLAGGHGKAVGKQREAIEKAQWTTIDLEEMAAIEKEIVEDETRDRSHDNLLHFTDLHKTYGHPDEMVVYLADTRRIHATFQSAVDYIEPEPFSMLTESHAAANEMPRTTVGLWRATVSFSEIFDPKPWDAELQDILAQMSALNAADPIVLQSEPMT